MKRILGSVLVMIGLIFPHLSQAVDRSSGCGLGRQIAPRKTLFSTSTAATTDGVSWPTQPSAMTSGTSGCAPHGLLIEASKREHFISTNIAAIKLESALGKGEHLAALGQFYGCGGSQEAFARTMKSNYYSVFKTSDAQTINQSITGLGCAL